MKIEIHILQSFPPANLNRDENGMPKSTVFGGRPRARISSQCQKRAVRKFYHENFEQELQSHFARRSKGWQTELANLLEKDGVEKSQADLVASCSISVLTETKELKGKSKKKSGDTEEKAEKHKSDTSLFIGNTEIQAILNFLKKNWRQVETDILLKEPAFSKQIVDGIKATLETNAKPGDIALFGRMMANLPSGNVDAAVQMAHAISIHTLQQEFDFFTAVDDLKNTEDKDPGADHLGETGYNASTYYRYTNVDTEQLIKNLGSKSSVQEVIKAFAQAFIEAIPSGHQNAFAAHSCPAVVMMVVRKGQPISLVDAFEDPVRPNGKNSLLDNAVIAIDSYWADLTKMYGNKTEYVGIVTRSKLAAGLTSLKSDSKDSVAELITAALAQAFPGA